MNATDRLIPFGLASVGLALIGVLCLLVSGCGGSGEKAKVDATTLSVDFSHAPSAPAKVKNSFGVWNVTAPPGMSPQAIPGQARLVMRARFDATGVHPAQRRLQSLYVAPTRSGGFCYQWIEGGGSCIPKHGARITRNGRHLAVAFQGDEFATTIDGYVLAGEGIALEARFADGATVKLPITRVSKPIDAGFFLYVVPTAHRTRATTATSVFALDEKGHVVDKHQFFPTNPLDLDVTRTLPDGTRQTLPARAETGTARKVISFRTTNGAHVSLWLMKRRGGGFCYVSPGGSGCYRPGELARGPALVGGPTGSIFQVQVRPGVAKIELRYQDGTREQLKPIEGFVIHEITPSHFLRGTRPSEALAFDSKGRLLGRERFSPNTPGMYPCKKPVPLGYNVVSCP